MEKDQHAIMKAYTMLISLRRNVEKLNLVDEKYVREFHAVLDRLQGMGMEVDEFHIPDSEVKPRVVAIHSLTFGSTRAGKSYSDEKYVDKAFLLTKLDAIIGYFEIVTSEEPRRIGFKK